MHRPAFETPGQSRKKKEKVSRAFFCSRKKSSRSRDIDMNVKKPLIADRALESFRSFRKKSKKKKRTDCAPPHRSLYSSSCASQRSAVQFFSRTDLVLFCRLHRYL